MEIINNRNNQYHTGIDDSGNSNSDNNNSSDDI